MQLNDPYLIESAIAGAFIHGLEDEFKEVRSATIGPPIVLLWSYLIDSMCEISQRSPHFAHLTVAPLVDMFNDEIDHVRNNSIHSLRRMGSGIRFNSEQLKIAMAALQDKELSTRLGTALYGSFSDYSAVYKLLSHIAFDNIPSISFAIRGLLANFDRYNEDKFLILSTCQAIGEDHQLCGLTAFRPKSFC